MIVENSNIANEIKIIADADGNKCVLVIKGGEQLNVRFDSLAAEFEPKAEVTEEVTEVAGDVPTETV